MLMKGIAVHSTLEFTACELDALTTLLALQADIHPKYVDGPTPTPTGVGLLEDDHVSDLPGRERR
jgi:hypothetical protein